MSGAPAPATVTLPAQRLVGLFGHPVAHTRSPAFQNAAFAARGLAWSYVPFDIRSRDLPRAFGAARTLSMPGFNLTIPHKEAAANLCDSLDASAAMSGACNTVVAHAGALKGYDTDGDGVLRALQELTGQSVRGACVGILGAGGSARACVAALARAGAAGGWLAARRVEAAQRLAETAGGWGLPLTPLRLGDRLPWADVILQCTPIGLGSSAGSAAAAEATAAFDAWLPRSGGANTAWMDLVYAPWPTPFVTAASRRPGVAADGRGMLLHQGALAFELWTGCDAPLDAMRAALDAAL